MKSLAGAAAAAAAAATVALSSCATVVEAIVDAGTVTTVTVDAPLYDTNLAAAGGCDPEGCVGDLTRVSRRVDGVYRRYDCDYATIAQFAHTVTRITYPQC